MSNTKLESISTESLHLVTGGVGQQKPAQQPKPKQQPKPDAYATHGNSVQQAGQMIDHAAGGYAGARKAGASVYESIGNAAIGFFGLKGGFDQNGNPR